MFAAISGILLAATQQQLDASLLALLVIQAFGAAVVGAFTSLPLAFIGGIALGVVQAISGKFVGQHPVLQGLDNNMPFLFLFVGLLVIPRSRLQELGRSVRLRLPVRVAPTMRTKYAGIAVCLAVSLVIPFLVGTKLASWNAALAVMPLFLSLGLLLRTSGQISLCQVGFAAIGATTFCHALSAGLPWGITVILAGLVAVPVGAVMAIPAIRLSALYLALATLGFGILIAQFAYSKPYMFGQGASLRAARPHILNLQTDRGYYFLLLACVVLSAAAVALVERARLGRLLRGMADSPTALSTLGTNVNVSRVIVFCISAFLAGVSGALTAALFPSISTDLFPYFGSLIVMTVLIVAGRRTVASAVLAALIFKLPIAYLSGGRVGEWLQLGFGVAAVGAALLVVPGVRSGLAHAAATREGRLPPRGLQSSLMPARSLLLNAPDPALLPIGGHGQHAVSTLD
jgi:ABC-type branched-subunit amino acid transport system permease subunit